MHTEPPATVQAQCWACAIQLRVPLQEGAVAPTFQCGHCGAITVPPKAGGGVRRHPRSAAREWLRVVAVGGVIAIIVALGVLVVLPQFSALWFHGIIIAWLLFNVLFNYYAACTKDSGVVKERLHSPGEAVEQGQFLGFTFCEKCEGPKPPDAHHCRTCGACINGLDHHCVFIRNCVGDSNRRWFILFLVWIEIASLYIILMTGALMRRRWDVVLISLQAVQRRFIWSQAWMLVLWIYQSSPPWLAASLCLMANATALLFTMGMLLQQQVLSLVSGISYIDALKMQHGDVGGRPFRKQSLRERVRKVFGTDPAWAWLLPRWSVPCSCKKGC